ncbi:MAG TPA: hypothetical protein VF021_02130 [Longimicrobiales bacterium]
MLHDREDDQDTARELFEEVERRAFMDLPAEDEEDGAELNLVAAFGDAGPAVDAAQARDMTLGGYVELHNRPPAFSGSDDQPYTVDVDVEPTGDPARPFAAFLVFVRWAATGAGIMEHTESGDVAHGDTPDSAKSRALELTLYEVKSELDAAIERKQRELED